MTTPITFILAFSNCSFILLRVGSPTSPALITSNVASDLEAIIYPSTALLIEGVSKIIISYLNLISFKNSSKTFEDSKVDGIFSLVPQGK